MKQEDKTQDHKDSPVKEDVAVRPAAPKTREEMREFVRAVIEEDFEKMEASLRYLADR